MPELLVRTFEEYDTAIARMQDRGYTLSQEDSDGQTYGTAYMFRPSDGLDIAIVWEV